MLGVVLNKVARRDASRYGYDDGYAPYAAAAPARAASSDSALRKTPTSQSEPSGRQENQGASEATSDSWPPADQEQARR